jgi:hypothetical protein
VVRTPGPLPGGQTFHDHEGVDAFLSSLQEMFEGLSHRAGGIRGSGDGRVFVTVRQRGKAKAGEMDLASWVFFHIWALRRRIVRFDAYFDRNSALRAAGFKE